MTIDIDIQAFVEYNANMSDLNTKITAFYPLLSTLQDTTNNGKIVVRRSNAWSCEDIVIYNGLYQSFGTMSGSLDLVLNNHSSRSAIIFTINGETLINGFGDNLLTGVVYTMFVLQDPSGGHKLRWPANTSVLGEIDEAPGALTVSMMIKLPDGKLFVKNKAYADTAETGYYEFRVVDDYLEISKSNVSVSGNVLSNDWGANTSVIEIDGDALKVGVAIAGSAGGTFTVNADGSWSFLLNDDFDYLEGADEVETSVTYKATNTVESLTATLKILVRGRWLPNDEVDMLQWLDADDYASFTLSGSNIAQWSDKSGKNAHVTQGTLSSMPLLEDSGLNLKDVVSFDGGDNMGAPAWMTEQDHWIFYVVKGNTNIPACGQTTGGTCLYNNNAGAITSAQQYGVGEQIGPNGFAAHQHRPNVICNLLYKAEALTDFNILGFKWESGGRLPSMYVNGVLSQTGVTANQTAHFWMNIGSGAYGSFSGKVAERLYTNGLPVQAVVDKIVGYLAHKWGLAGKLDALHPYKSIIP